VIFTSNEIPTACANCGKPSTGRLGMLGKTVDGFDIDQPTCRHAIVLMCPDCKAAGEFATCPICGCTEVYT
jgi:hypothetical protein